MGLGLFRFAFDSCGPVGSIVSLPRGMLGKLFQVFWRRGRRCSPGDHMTVAKFSRHLRAFVTRSLYQLCDQLPHSPIVGFDSLQEEIWHKVGSWIWSKSVYPLHALVPLLINGTYLDPMPHILPQFQPTTASTGKQSFEAATARACACGMVPKEDSVFP
jgi:hypothetical protein